MNSLFITGTDTEVGKTVVSAILGLAYQQIGINVGYFKPVQSGAENLVPPDAVFCQKVLNLKIDSKELCTYIFEPPVSPHLAAKWSGIEIDPNYIKQHFDRLKKRYDALLVEGAGGLLVPLRDNFFMRDLIKILNLPIVIVARAGLGTLNHTFLTLECARQAGIKVLGVIFNRVPSNPSALIKDNIKTIASIGKTKILGIIPEISLKKEALLEVAKTIDLGEHNGI